VEGYVDPLGGDIDAKELLVGHEGLRQHGLVVHTPGCIRARAPSSVRVRDRDAGGLKMATVV
jgi:hypothetical protein